MNEISLLSHDITYRRYQLSRINIGKVFRILNIPEYIALHAIRESEFADMKADNQVYLKDIARQMEVTISQASRIAGLLRDKGLVIWSHEGDGDKGTYLKLTESGIMKLHSQEEILEKYYKTIIDQFGLDRLNEWLLLTQELDNIMRKEAEKSEGKINDSDNQ